MGVGPCVPQKGLSSRTEQPALSNRRESTPRLPPYGFFTRSNYKPAYQAPEPGAASKWLNSSRSLNANV